MQFVLRATTKTIVLFILISTIAGCSRLQFPWVYKIYIQQGNYLEKDMIEQLEAGMTPEQVRYVMGNPLVEDTFHPDRWDYYFSMRHGDKLLREKRFSVYFQDGKLARWDGDYDLNTAVEELTEKMNQKQGKEGAEEVKEVVPAK